jgi:hypothetical protein
MASTSTERPNRRSKRRALLVLTAALGIASMSAASFSLALFTASTTVADNAFSTGTIIIDTDHNATAVIGFTNMLPGDYVTAPLVVSNAGTGALRYSVVTTISGETKGLGGQLQLQIKTLGTDCNTFDGDLLYGNATPEAFVGTGPIDGISRQLESLTKPVNAAFIGSAATGQDTGDRVLAGSDNGAPIAVGTASRADAASGASPTSETLCFRTYLPKNATGNAFQAAAVTASFDFTAEQTANN